MREDRLLSRGSLLNDQRGTHARFQFEVRVFNVGPDTGPVIARIDLGTDE
eukprot:NODE_25375_length_224_cov_1.382857_g24205_i0.p1 GENE.NODE_25375_length_224_cov_1.382857_g24205_i0~~NODE_25375_length_224_cov_1.382857_g24205_i0.p1  ORF type:complete len:50 (+),score=4.13 NODE_25375_length_224_cov_1.382857_g24205_i0:50-199(+)